jgi:biopolymer transport protein ExbD
VTERSSDSDQAEAELPSFTEPFRLSSRLKKPAIGLDLLPVLDLLTIALLLGLLFTRFVMFPGVRVELPSTDMRMPQSHSEVAVMTIGSNGMLFFNGNVYDEKSIHPAFTRFVEKTDDQRVALLVKIQSSMSIQSFLALCEAAQNAGFYQVQIAGKKSDQLADQLPGLSSDAPDRFISP